MSSVFDSRLQFPRSLAAASVPKRHKLLQSLATRLGFASASANTHDRTTARAVAAAATPPRQGWSHNMAAMLAAGETMVARARRDKLPLSIAVFDLNDLPELETVFGPKIARDVVAQVVLRLQGVATSKGLVLRTDATVFTVLMPGFGRDRAQLAIQTTMGSPCCIELDADDHEIVLVPEFKIHTLRADSSALSQVYLDLRCAISEAQKREQRRQRYLQLERESHTRPLELRTGGERTPSRARRPAFVPAATIPMPLKR